jgi:hypothetical protein
MRLLTFPGPMQLPQGAPQRFDLSLVLDLLPLRQLNGLQYLFHFIERPPEQFDDAVDLRNRLADC